MYSPPATIAVRTAAPLSSPTWPWAPAPAWLLTWPLAHRSLAWASQPVSEKQTVRLVKINKKAEICLNFKNPYLLNHVSKFNDLVVPGITKMCRMQWCNQIQLFIRAHTCYLQNLEKTCLIHNLSFITPNWVNPIGEALSSYPLYSSTTPKIN